MNSYDFIGIDEGKQTIFRADSGSGRFLWKRSLSDFPTARALQNLGNGNILAGYDRGFMEIRANDGKIVHYCSQWDGITSAFRREDGSTLLTGLNLEGEDGICVITLDSHGSVISIISTPGDYIRLLSMADQNSYLLSTNDCITETDLQLKTVRKYQAEGFLHAWQSLRLDDGRTLVSGGYGAFMAVFDREGNLLRKFGSIVELPSDVSPFFYASFQFAPDGSLLVANWQGHGPKNGRKGKQLIRFSSEWEYLESRSFPEDVSSLQGLLILR